MKADNHTKFILTPILEILKDCVNATKAIGLGIETYPLCDYIMQTTFLKMTGASEQKLKCILWEIATNDYDYRYRYLSNSTKSGECSKLKDKNDVFKELQNQILTTKSAEEALKQNFNCSNKRNMLDRVLFDITSLFYNSVLISWQENEFLFFKRHYSHYFAENFFCNYSNKDKKFNTLLESKIDYDNLVWRHRNRCAHNLASYQVNLPDLSQLIQPNYDYENYFFRFSILLLLDEIFMKMYSSYLEHLDKNC